MVCTVCGMRCVCGMRLCMWGDFVVCVGCGGCVWYAWFEVCVGFVGFAVCVV